MNVTLCNRDHPEYGVATIPLPMEKLLKCCYYDTDVDF